MLCFCINFSDINLNSPIICLCIKYRQRDGADLMNHEWVECPYSKRYRDDPVLLWEDTMRKYLPQNHKRTQILHAGTLTLNIYLQNGEKHVC